MLRHTVRPGNATGGQDVVPRMSAYVEQNEIADPFILQVIDRPEPHAGPGEVRIRARAAGLNPVDWKIAAHPQVATAFGISAPTGFGNDVAGVVDEVGPGVATFAVGDRIFASARGHAVAEHVVLDANAAGIHRTPDGLADEIAGALPIAARTADAALATARIGEGDTVLIGGAAGGVGVLAVQLAVRAGATVIATASPANHDFLRELGATPTEYGDGLADRVRALAPDGLDAAVDLHGVEAIEAAAALGVPGDRLATIAAANPPHGAVATGGQDARPGAVDAIAALLASGELTLPIAARFPIGRIDDAVALQRGGHVRGKIVITL